MVQSMGFKLTQGSLAPSLNLTGVDNQKHSLEEFQSPILVIFFTSDECEFMKRYHERVMKLAGEYRGRVSFVGINSATVKEQCFERMQELAREKAFNFTYLRDENQKTAFNKDYTIS